MTRATIFAAIAGLIVFSVILGIASLVIDLRGRRKRAARPFPGHFDVTWVRPDASTSRVRADVVELTDETVRLDCSVAVPLGAIIYLENRPNKLSGTATVESCRAQAAKVYRVNANLSGAVVAHVAPDRR